MKLFAPDAPIPGLPHMTVLDFWQWAYSDVLSNRNRAVFAEFIVGAALGCLSTPRIEWDAVDLRYRGLAIEVKSASGIQSWPQKKLSPITFGIAKALAWDASTGTSQTAPIRSADLYVFCHYRITDREKVNILDLAGWDFYIVPAATLERELPEAKSASLATIRRFASARSFGDLRVAVDALLAQD